MNGTAAYALVMAGSGLCFTVAIVRYVTAWLVDAHAEQSARVMQASAQRQAYEHQAAVARIIAAKSATTRPTLAPRRKELTR